MTIRTHDTHHYRSRLRATARSARHEALQIGLCDREAKQLGLYSAHLAAAGRSAGQASGRAERLAESWSQERAR